MHNSALVGNVYNRAGKELRDWERPTDDRARGSDDSARRKNNIPPSVGPSSFSRPAAVEPRVPAPGRDPGRTKCFWTSRVARSRTTSGTLDTVSSWRDHTLITTINTHHKELFSFLLVISTTSTLVPSWRTRFSRRGAARCRRVCKYDSLKYDFLKYRMDQVCVEFLKYNKSCQFDQLFLFKLSDALWFMVSRAGSMDQSLKLIMQHQCAILALRRSLLAY